MRSTAVTGPYRTTRSSTSITATRARYRRAVESWNRAEAVNAGGWAVADTELLDASTGRRRQVAARPGGGFPAVSAWTGDEIVTWGGTSGRDRPRLLRTGAAYTPPALPDGPGRPLPPTTPPETEPHVCAAAPGSRFDTAHEPRGPEYEEYTPWTDDEGCIIRIDEIADHPAPRCSTTRVTTISGRIARGLGFGTEPITYVRADIDPDADPGSTKLMPGFHHGGEELWFVIGDPTSLYVRSTDLVERWPAQEPPVCR